LKEKEGTEETFSKGNKKKRWGGVCGGGGGGGGGGEGGEGGRSIKGDEKRLIVIVQKQLDLKLKQELSYGRRKRLTVTMWVENDKKKKNKRKPKTQTKNKKKKKKKCAVNARTLRVQLQSFANPSHRRKNEKNPETSLKEDLIKDKRHLKLRRIRIIVEKSRWDQRAKKKKTDKIWMKGDTWKIGGTGRFARNW